MNKKPVNILRNVLSGRFAWTVILLLGVTTLCLTQPRLQNYIGQASVTAGSAKDARTSSQVRKQKHGNSASASDSLLHLPLSGSARFNSGISPLSRVPANVTVTSLADSGSGSLREALTLVPSGGTIDFAVTGTITLSSALTVPNCTIAGPGAGLLTISGNNSDRVFAMNFSTVTLSGLTIANGIANSDGQGGGAFNTAGAITIESCVFSNNSAPGGHNGGAIEAFFGGHLNINNSTFTNNTAGQTGGAIKISDAGSPSSNIITNSTFSGNSALFGGALFTNTGSAAVTLTLTNDTFANNTATNPSGDGGGGLCQQSQGSIATINITNCTFVGNTSTGTSGAVENIQLVGTATMSIKNTIFSGNNPSSAHQDHSVITSLGNNITSDNPGIFTASGDQVNTNPLIGALQNNGGPTQTFALLPGSPAINAGNNTGAPATDQRGVVRPQNSTVDVGSYELNSPVNSSVSVGTSGSPSLPGASVTFTATVSAVGIGGTPSGNIQFKDNGTNLGSPVALSSGVATLMTSSLALGAHTISAGYGGDSTFDPSTNSVSQQVNNPTPLTASISPTNASAGGSGFTLTVNGSGFVNTNVVRWNGSNRTTTFVSGSQLTATIPASDIASVGSATVTVFETVGSVTSNGQTFTINAPSISTTSISPTSAPVGSGAFTLAVNGTGFVSGDVVRWNGSNRATTFVSATQLTAAIPASDLIALVGTASVTVFDSGSSTTTNAQTFTLSADVIVSNLTDNSATPPVGSLRKALVDVPLGGTIGFSVTGTITISTTALSVAKRCTIGGPGATSVTVSGGSTVRVFSIAATPVTISGLTIANGSFAGAGGGLSSAGIFAVTINDSVFTGNAATGASGNGGAISNSAGGTMNINRTTFTSNTAAALGAAVVNSNGSSTASSLTMTNCTISGNSGIGTGAAGGVVNLASSATGIANTTVMNCTFVNNTVSGGTGGTTAGGASNRRSAGTAGSFTITNSIFRGNTTPSVVASGTSAALTSGGGNVFLDSPSGFTTTNDKKSTDPLLGSLQNNGGPTSTFALLPGSPAIGNGVSTGAPATDQRGVPRPQNTTYDSGAYELRSPLNSSTAVITSGSPSINGNSVTFTATVSPVGIAGTPTGSVQFKDNGTTLGAAVTLSGGVAALTTSAVQGGTRTITAVYNGDSTFDPSSGAVTQQVNNPVPVTTSLSPNSAFVGSGAFTLTVNGSNFVNGNTVLWNASSRTTTFINGNQLTASIPASDVASIGSASVTVFESQAGVSSNSQTFTITPILVTNLNDSGSGSLRAALAAVASGGTISFQAGLTGTINLATTLSITTPCTINGPGAGSITINGGNAVQIFNISAGSGTISVSGLTLANGFTSTAFGGGAAFNVQNVTLNIDSCVFTHNVVTNNLSGGAIYNFAATLNVNNSTFTNNSASDAGGAIAAIGNGAVATTTITNSTFTQNSATNSGGALSNESLSGSTSRGVLSITNSTVTGNTAPSGSAIASEALGTATATATVTNCTIANNTGTGNGAIFNLKNTTGVPTFNVQNTILSSNTPSNASTANASFTSQGNNLLSDSSSGFTASGDLTNTNALLAALGDNGGPTFTMGLLPGSPAIDAGNNTGAPATDQRGVTRPQGAKVDIGAYELRSPANSSTSVITSGSPSNGGAPVTFTATVSPVGTTGTPTGSVQFKDNGVNLGSPVALTSGVAALTTTAVSSGTRTITAAYGGSPAFDPSSGTVTQQVIPQTFTVTSLNNSGTGTLRDIYAAAPGGSTINFAVTGTITLTSQISMAKVMTISGPGASVLTISGGNTNRIFEITSGTTAISGLRFANGNAGVANGGAIRNDAATLSIDSCIFANNTVDSVQYVFGGAISNEDDGALTINNTTFTGNHANGGLGGAIFHSGRVTTATATITNSTFTGNTAGYGGAIYNSGDGGVAQLSMTNCTVSGNTGLTSLGSGNAAGGIQSEGNSNVSVTLLNTTFANNTVTGSPSPAEAVSSNSSGTATLNIKNSIFAGSSASATTITGTVTSQGNNLSTDNPGFGATGDKPNTQPLIGPLQDNGGPTFTHSLLPGSPAIDAGNNTGAPATDQRGVTRPQNLVVDMGAYELRSPLNTSTSVISSASPITTGDTVTYTATVTSLNGTPTGVVQFFDNGTSLGTATLVSGVAALTTSPIGVGGRTITAAYTGNATFDPSSGTLTEQVNLGAVIVTNTNDSGPGSLRQALAIGGGNITFAANVTGTILLSSPISVSGTYTVTGPGASVLAVSGGNSTQIMAISNSNVTIYGLKFSNGFANSQDGAAILNDASILNIDSCVFSNNTVSGTAGAAIANKDGSTLTINNSTFNNNTSSFYGGAIINAGAVGETKLTITNSTFNQNSATYGGAIANRGDSAQATLTMTNSTISGNTATATDGSGGAIDNFAPGGPAVATLTNCTIANNIVTSPGTSGGAFWNSGTFQIKNTIIKGNTLPNVVAAGGTFTSQGNNIIDDATGTFNQASDKKNTNALIGPLQNNGGPTQTHSLLSGSPAIDAGNNTGAPATDQRGVTRPQNGTVDVGAYELRNPANSSTSVTTSGSPSVGGTPVTFTATVAPVGTTGTPTGTVQFQDNGVNLGSPVALSGGVAALTTSNVKGGARTISATYSGDSAFDPSVGTVSQQVNNPTPVTTSISPNTATAGSGTFTLTVNGSGFVAENSVRWNGSNRTTTFVNNTQLTASIPASDLLTIGTANVTVFEPSNAVTSNAQTFMLTASVIVTTTADSGAGSLRQALIDVPNGGAIGFAVTGTITVTNTLSITKACIIAGPGASNLTISGGNSVRIFSVGASGVTISGLTIANGRATSSGGALTNSGAFTTTIASSVFTGNTVTGVSSNGGAIFNSAAGQLTISDSTFSNNTAGNQGGAITNSGSTSTTRVTVTGSTFTGNSAVLGGAIYNIGTSSGAVLSMTNCTISGNTATGATTAGGIDNVSNASGAAGTTTLTNCTVANNTDSGTTPAGGLRSRRVAGATQQSFTLKNTIVSGNTSPNIAISGTSSVFTSSGGNIISDNGTSAFTQTNDQRNTNPLIGSLQNNGGLTMTHSLLSGSPAIDSGNNTGAPATDQRGVARPVNGTVDIGAFENLVNVNPANLALIVVGSPVNQTITATGGTAPYTFAFTGTLPTGVSLAANGTESGTATAVGPFSFTVTATDSNGFAGSRSYTVTADSPPTATVLLNTGAPFTNDILTATSTRADLDGQSVALRYVWKNNGSIVRDVTKNTGTPADLTDSLDLSVAGNGDKGDTTTVEVTPNDGLTNGAVALASATVVNSAPTDITLSNNSVAENNPVGTTVGTFTFTDADTGDTPTFGFATGTGADDNGSFTIAGNTLKTSAIFDATIKSSYTIRVSATDNSNASFEKVFVITITSNRTAIVVNSLADTISDDGSCTLREAITLANTRIPSGNTAGECVLDTSNPVRITFSVNGTISLLTALPAIDSNVNIQGPTASALKIMRQGGSPNFGIFSINSGRTAAIHNLTISNGSAADGGAINNAGNLTIDSTTISGNTASTTGGGIRNDGTMTVVNSTMSGNSSSGDGGGIYNTGTLIVSSSTVTGNSSATNAGGIQQSGGTATIDDTIIAGNNGAVAGPDVKGSFISQGHNIIGKSDGSTGFANGSNGDIVGTVASSVDARLGALADNGGPTFTHALLAGSPAFDAGNSTGAPPTDQRGFNRGIVDIGAYEAQPWISHIADQSTVNGIAVVNFNIGDTTISSPAISGVSALSADTNLVPNTNLVITGSGGGRTLTITPAAGQSGSTTITVTVSAGASTMSTSFTLTVVAAGPTKLAITQVNGGANPIAGAPFTVIIQSLDSSNTPVNVLADTAVTLSLIGGNGTLGGTLTGTILGGTNSVTISGATYNKAESGVVIRASRISGDSLSAGDSAPFTVNSGTVSSYLLTPTTTSPTAGVADRVAIQPKDAFGNNTVGSGTVTITGRNVADTANDSNVQVDANKDGTYGDNVVDTSAGAATFDIKNAAVESFKVKASDGSFSGISATITTVASNKYIVTVSNIRPNAGSAVTVSAQYADRDNNPVSVSGRVVTWSSTSGGSFSAGTSTTNSNGVANITFTSSSTIGAAQTITATDNANNTFTGSSALSTVPAPGQIQITEFRFHGANGATDEFIELFNSSTQAATVADSDQNVAASSGGWTISTPTGAVATIPAGTTIPGRGHYLLTGSGFSLTGYPAGVGGTTFGGAGAGAPTIGTGDQSYTMDIPDGSGIALFNTATAARFTGGPSGTRLDAAGFSGVANTLYREGTGLTPSGGITVNGQYSFVRKSAATGMPQDIDDNVTDFWFVATNAVTGDTATYGRLAVLGAPGPEGKSSPPFETNLFAWAGIDPNVGVNTGINQIRITTSSFTNAANGLVSVRRTVTNQTGHAVTRLRFRVIDLTTTNSPNEVGGANQVDSRIMNPTEAQLNTIMTTLGNGITAADATSFTITTSIGPVTVYRTRPETTPDQSSKGGGLNTGEYVFSLVLPTALPNNGSVSVEFLLGQNFPCSCTASWKIVINVEALP